MPRSVQTSGIHSSPQVKRRAAASGIHGVENSRSRGAFALAATIRGNAKGVASSTIAHCARNASGTSIASWPQRLIRLARQRIDDVEIAHRLGGSRMRPQRFDVNARHRLRRGDQRVGEPAFRQPDDQVVDGASGPRSITSSDSMSTPAAPSAVATAPSDPGRSGRTSRRR